MNNIGVLMTCPMSEYLENQLENRFSLFKLWNHSSPKPDFLKTHSSSIKAVVGNTKIGADANMIDSLPNMEIVASYSVGLDKIDLGKCKEKGIKVTNTPDVLTDDVADLGIGLALAVLRKMCVCDRFVRSGNWINGDFGLASKVRFWVFLFFLIVSLLVFVFFIQFTKNCVLVWWVLVSNYEF